MGLLGGDSTLCSWRTDRRGTFFRLFDSFFNGLGDILVDSMDWEESVELNQTPRDESEAEI